MSANKNKLKRVRPHRNMEVVPMILRGGQGIHPDQKKKANRNACRGQFHGEG